MMSGSRPREPLSKLSCGPIRQHFSGIGSLALQVDRYIMPVFTKNVPRSANTLKKSLPRYCRENCQKKSELVRDAKLAANETSSKKWAMAAQ